MPLAQQRLLTDPDAARRYHQDALAVVGSCSSVTEIWVAEGVYILSG